ncbi:Hsp20/alpha crystallin family protein [Loigolactobacillus bifermentans]|uniref:SHSP domain-containing protein n=1 Tax=Loigolactobacillus bifermentans DSM 20003 TaxID=1423726 RepID=A0A0R1H9Z4_9LACO|nr:Hsp20/alpha crystallin family protein [Loigolactobacillus bifermentans]KRK40482.1 hypothetical protein FC07_GL000493 [Loigolactobacillus bifermentans DSM 20003]
MTNEVDRHDNYPNPFDFFNNWSPFHFETPTFNVDIHDKEQAYQVTAELPGFDKAELQLDYRHDTLTISAQHRQETDTKNDQDQVVRHERHMGTVSRQFYLKNGDRAHIKASYQDGLLSITIPKKAGATDEPPITIE